LAKYLLEGKKKLKLLTIKDDQQLHAQVNVLRNFLARLPFGNWDIIEGFF